MQQVKGYADGYAYARALLRQLPSTTWRKPHNVDFVRSSKYVAHDSPTRAYWLGFCRGLRA